MTVLSQLPLHVVNMQEYQKNKKVQQLTYYIVIGSHFDHFDLEY